MRPSEASTTSSRGGADAAEQRRGELARRGERHGVAHGEGAADLREAGQHVERVVLAQHERLDEGLGAHHLRALDVRRHVDVEDASDPSGAPGDLRPLDLGLVEPVAQHRPLGHQHRTVGPGDVAAHRRERAQPEGVAVGEVGRQRVGRPVDLPAGPGRHEGHRRVVLPGRRVGQLPPPGQRRRRGAGLVAGALDLVDRGDLDGDRHLLQRGDEVGERGAVGVVDQGHVGERVG